MRLIQRVWGALKWRLGRRPPSPVAFPQYADEFLDKEAVRNAYVTPDSKTRFKIVYDGRVIYEGPHGETAKRIYECCVPKDRMEFWDNGACRSTKYGETVR